MTHPVYHVISPLCYSFLSCRSTGKMCVSYLESFQSFQMAHLHPLLPPQIENDGGAGGTAPIYLLFTLPLDERIRETKLSERAPSGDAYPWKAEIVHFKKLELAQF